MKPHAFLYSFTRDMINGARRMGRRRFSHGALVALLLSGCQVLPEAQPDPTRYFVLRADTPAADVTAPREDGLAIGLNAIELPAYLRNNRSMIVARGGNELVFREYDRWAEPLEAGLSRVIRETLAATPGIAEVDTFPFTSDRPRDVDVTIRVLHCEGAEAADGRRVARLEVVYEIAKAGVAGRRVVEGRFAATERQWNGEADALAAALGAAAVETANAIADALTR